MCVYIFEQSTMCVYTRIMLCSNEQRISASVYVYIYARKCINVCMYILVSEGRCLVLVLVYGMDLLFVHSSLCVGVMMCS